MIEADVETKKDAAVDKRCSNCGASRTVVMSVQAAVMSNMYARFARLRTKLAGARDHGARAGVPMASAGRSVGAYTTNLTSYIASVRCPGSGRAPRAQSSGPVVARACPHRAEAACSHPHQHLSCCTEATCLLDVCHGARGPLCGAAGSVAVVGCTV